MNLKKGFAIAGTFLLLACGGEKGNDSKKESKQSPTKENKDLTKETYSNIVGDWMAYEIAASPEDELTTLPTTEDIYLVIKDDRTFYTFFNLDTVTSGNYTVKEGQVVFNETKNYHGDQLRYLSTKVIVEGDKMELIGEWVEHDGMKEYHHSTFVKGKYNRDRIQDRLNLSKKEK